MILADRVLNANNNEKFVLIIINNVLSLAKRKAAGYLIY